MTARQRRLADYTRRVLGTNPGAGLEAVAELSGHVAESAGVAIESVLNDRDLNFQQQFALEAIVLPKLRPAALIRDGGFSHLPDPWAGLSAYRDELKPAIQAVGRVEVAGAGIPFGGTAFLCGPNLMMTNRHVAQLFVYGVGAFSRLRFIPGRVGSIENGHEHGVMPVAGLKFKILKAVMIHPHWDAAVFQVEFQVEAGAIPKPVQLRSTPIPEEEFANRDIVVIGYPYYSSGHGQQDLNDVFNGIYGVKRFQPGKLMKYEAVGSFGRTVEALLHDASTLGGNSGSEVIDVETQQVAALHFAGTYLVGNYSVPMWELAKDPRLVDAGLNFVPPPAANQPRTAEQGGPAWLSAWSGRDELPAPAGVPAGTLSATTVAALKQEHLSAPQPPLLDPGWLERYADEEIRRMYQRDPEQFRRLLATSYSPEEAQEIYDTVLFDASIESVRVESPDQALPEIVLLPGIMGSHLNNGGIWGRAWLNALTMPFVNFPTMLGLDVNGNDPNSLRPDGYIQMYYGKAARTWRAQRFTVHQFSYDWRKPLTTSAERLDTFMRQRKVARPEARFALVCHSMGSLVASIYARDFGDWRDFVSQAIFCGGPLGGSFAIMEMLSGEWPTVRKIAAISQDTSVLEMRQMGAGFPGALQMLPNPKLFSKPGADAEMLYDPTSYLRAARPGADWLRDSRRLKDDLRHSPLHGRTTCLVCVDRPTAGSFILKDNEVLHDPNGLVRGDAAVPAASALIDGVSAYCVDYEHGDLMLDPKVLDAVPRLLRGELVPIEAVTQARLEAPLPKREAIEPEAVEAKWQMEAALIRERMRNGVATAEDFRWIQRTE